MKRRACIYYTPEQKDIFWGRYKQDDSLHDIARMFDRYHSSIMPTIHQTGGYRPPVRKRHQLALSLDEREEISRALVAKKSIRAANKLSRAPSTISRDVGLGIFNATTLAANVYGVFGLTGKAEAWRLFRYLPGDYYRKVETMSPGRLTMKVLGWGVSAKVVLELLTHDQNRSR